MRPSTVAFALVLLPAVLPAQRPSAFRVEETTISGIHAAFRAKTLSCRALVQRYLERIEAYDKRGPAINALVTVNPAALAVADSLDARYAKDGPVGALHCIPMIVKDNFETRDLQTTAGSLALKGWIPRRDATMVARIRAAGGHRAGQEQPRRVGVLAVRDGEFDSPGIHEEPVHARPRDGGLERRHGGGGRRQRGAVGLGTDTGNSIRGPSAHNALVGIRSTMGLTSRAGVVPLANGADIAGPMARTVADAVAVFQVVAGEDADDPVTAPAREHREADYRRFVVSGGLKGARIGVLRQAYERPTTDSEVVRVFTRALETMQAQGRPSSTRRPSTRSRRCCAPPAARATSSAARPRGVLGRARENAPVKTIDEIVKSGSYHPLAQTRLQAARR